MSLIVCCNTQSFYKFSKLGNVAKQVFKSINYFEIDKILSYCHKLKTNAESSGGRARKGLISL